MIRSAASYETRYRTHILFSSAIAAVAVLGEVESRHRALLYISNGYPLDLSTFIETRALARLSTQNRVKVFAIDASSLGASTQPATVHDPAREAQIGARRRSLQILAEQSDGFAVFDGTDIPAAFKRIMQSIQQ